MTLGEQQRKFAYFVGQLLNHIYTNGYEVTFDWAYRPPDVAAYYASIGVGIRSSLHSLKLAVDLNLFRDGVWLRSTEDWRRFGEWWELQHPLCCWGGKFGDGNHFSMTFGGVK